jgi:cell shape-determining protein MreC
MFWLQKLRWATQIRNYVGKFLSVDIGTHYAIFLAHPQFFVLVGIQGGGIGIIRLGGCLSFHETPPHVPQGEA